MPAPTMARSTLVVTTRAPEREEALRLWQQHVDDHPDELDIAQRQAIADHGEYYAANAPGPLPAADRRPQSGGQHDHSEAGCGKLPPPHQEMQHWIVVHAVVSPSRRSWLAIAWSAGTCGAPRIPCLL